MHSVSWHRLGRVEYADGLELQNQFQAARKAGAVDDTLLLLEHPAVLTLGRGADGSNILRPRDELERLGVGVFETDRGGDVTYHGPGQIVGYPLLHLGPGRQDVRRYVRSIEEVIIRSLADFGIVAVRIEKWPGVWVEQSRLGGPRKICALGVHLSRWYTRHGFALNVDPDLSHFELIVPCGISEAGVTSMAKELSFATPSMVEVEERLVHHFGAVFESAMAPSSAPIETVSVMVVSSSRERVLLLKRTEPRGGFWQPVTGRVEDGERPDRAAVRELAEETGLELPVQPIDAPHAFALGGLEGAPKVMREFPFVARASDDAVVRLSAEHDAFEWLTPAEATARVPWEGLRRSVRTATKR
ncbi:MAG: lipoyl(octanoyl) transferase LipB [Myxococcales bacterium]|nr:lipoyl(octanoyl) transferase LipB [Myxococcales bacterium]MDP3501887.1 lipoyl(octanoyl) transferase LipB [Myxococcales bacterium]